MSDDIFLEDDDSSDGKQASAGAKKSAVSGLSGGDGTPGFNPFADAAPSGKASSAKAPSAKASSAKAPPAAPEKQTAPSPGSSAASDNAASDDDDGPVDRRDLWECPHCGAKNKPKRSHCRACGKSPDEPVIGPWYTQPRQLGIVGLAIVTLWLIVSLLFGVDLTLRPAGPDTLDASVRMGSASGSVTVGDREVAIDSSLAVSGRVVSERGPSGSAHWHLVVLMLGDATVINDDREFSKYRAEIKTDSIDLRLGNGYADVHRFSFVALHIPDDNGQLSDLAAGDYLSLVGESGAFSDRQPRSSIDRRRREWVVVPRGVETFSP